MANLKEIRTRLATVISTRQITSAMKMVSAAKLRKAQDAIIQMRPFAYKLNEILHHCEACFCVSKNQLLIKRPVKRVLIVLISSNRGLCGAFNISVAKTAVHFAKEKFNPQLIDGNVDFIAIGRKGAEYFRNKGIPLIEIRNDLLDDLNFDKSSAFIEQVMEKYMNGYYDHIEIVYNRFKNALVQIITTETFLPLQPFIESDTATAQEVYKEVSPEKPAEEEYIIEPSIDYLVKKLIPKMLKTDFYKALLDSCASEHGARMTAMHKASDNATQMITELRINYNKARQSSITNEILEIAGGAESLGR